MLKAKLACSVFLGIAFLFVASVHGENWPRFRGPNGTGVSLDKNVPVKFNVKTGENLLWKVKLPGQGNSSAVVWDKQIFVQSATLEKRFLSCLDLDGNILWSRDFPGAKAHTHQKNTLASATPATDGQAVYAAFWDGKEVSLAAFSMKGDLLWSKNLGRWVSQHGPGHSPVIYKDKLIFCNDMDAKDKDENVVPNPSILRVFDKKTGTIAWEAAREGYRACYSAPFILEKAGSPPQMIITSTTSIRSYDPDNGNVNWDWRWTFTAKMPLRTTGSSIVHQNMLFACSGDGGGDRHMVAVKLAGPKARPELAWENKKDFPYVPTLLARGDHLYFVNDKGFAGCFHAVSGKRVWFERLPETTFASSPVLVDDKMYAVSEEGEVYVFAAETKYNLLAKSSLGERARSTPAVSNNRMYIRGMDHLFCIGQRN